MKKILMLGLVLIFSLYFSTTYVGDLLHAEEKVVDRVCNMEIDKASVLKRLYILAQGCSSYPGN